MTYRPDCVGYRVLIYIDDLLIAPRGGRAETAADCLRALQRLDHVLRVVGIEWHQTKGVCRKGASEFDHLGFHISGKMMRFTMIEKKQERIRRMVGKLLRQAGQKAGMISASCLSSSCGTTVSLSWAAPLAGFTRTRSRTALTYAERKRGKVSRSQVARQPCRTSFYGAGLSQRVAACRRARSFSKLLPR